MCETSPLKYIVCFSRQMKALNDEAKNSAEFSTFLLLFEALHSMCAVITTAVFSTVVIITIPPWPDSHNDTS